MNEESCSGSNSTVWSGDGDSSHRRSFAGENRTFHLLAFAYSFAEAPRVQYHSHSLSMALDSADSALRWVCVGSGNFRREV